jgi:hypothetical protein
MKRSIVSVVLMVLCFAVPAAAPEPVRTCLACLHACTGQGMNTPVCLMQCVTSGACVRP